MMVVQPICYKYKNMFSRSFMKAFNANKYRNPLRISANDVNYTHEHFPRRDYFYFRAFTGLAVVYTIYLAYKDPSVFFELMFHPHYPLAPLDVISRGVPKEIRIPNEQVIENARKLHQIEEFVKDFKPQ